MSFLPLPHYTHQEVRRQHNFAVNCSINITGLQATTKPILNQEEPRGNHGHSSPTSIVHHIAKQALHLHLHQHHHNISSILPLSHQKKNTILALNQTHSLSRFKAMIAFFYGMEDEITATARSLPRPSAQIAVQFFLSIHISRLVQYTEPTTPCHLKFRTLNSIHHYEARLGSPRAEGNRQSPHLLSG